MAEANSKQIKEEIAEQFPLHWLVWNNEPVKLNQELSSNLKKFNIEQLDPRGRTPLMLAVTLGHLESTRVLLNFEANVNYENKAGWNVVHEATSTGDPELLQLVLEHREHQRQNLRVSGIPSLLQKLQEAPDFYVEMKWEFTSWVPLVSRMCPSDTYKVYKHGSKVRVDTTLIGFDHKNNWQRGNMSIIFKSDESVTVFMEVNHDTRKVHVEKLETVPQIPDMQMAFPSERMVTQRLTSPTVIMYVDMEKISFQRNKSGFWGWRSDKIESVNGFECKVFKATSVELISKTRTDHLPEAERERAKKAAGVTPLQAFLGVAESKEANKNGHTVVFQANPCSITVEEYFSTCDLHKKDIGRPKEISTKTQSFSATLCLSEDYPLSLQEQIVPIVDLMAASSPHFAKLKDFIQMQLPSGFPVRIEIPVFHVLNARITFGNIFGMDEAVPWVTHIQGDKASCVIDEKCFEIPSDYVNMGVASRRSNLAFEEEDELLQFAIQQSLLEAGNDSEPVDIWEVLQACRPPTTPTTTMPLVSEEERQLQMAIQASLSMNSMSGILPSFEMLDDNTNSISNPSYDPTIPAIPLPQSLMEPLPDLEPLVDDDLELALQLSQKQLEAEKKRRQEEEEMFERILQLSLTEK